MWECEKDSLLSIDSYSFYVLNILRQESRMLRSLRFSRKWDNEKRQAERFQEVYTDDYDV